MHLSFIVRAVEAWQVHSTPPPPWASSRGAHCHVYMRAHHKARCVCVRAGQAPTGTACPGTEAHGPSACDVSPRGHHARAHGAVLPPQHVGQQQGPQAAARSVCAAPDSTVQIAFADGNCKSGMHAHTHTRTCMQRITCLPCLGPDRGSAHIRLLRVGSGNALFVRGLC